MNADDSVFVPELTAAIRLGVPIAWLRREAEAERVPCLRAGRRRLYDVQAVHEVLRDRPAAEGAESVR